MNKKKTKGFSLIELIVVVAILAIMGAVLVPAVMNSLKQGKIDNDESYVKQLANTIQMGAQETKTYYNLTRICEDSTNEYVEIVFASEFDGSFDYKKMNDIEYETPAGDDIEEVKRLTYAANFEQGLKDYINGTMEMTPMQSDLYRNRELTFRIELTNRDYQVKVTYEWSELDE